jgi:ribosomal protein S17
MGMKQIIVLLGLVALATGVALAHGKEEHIMGTVSAMTESSITVQTKAKNPVIVYTMAETKYEKSGATAAIKDLKVGDRVVIHATRLNGKLMANEIHFGAVKHATASR